MKALRLLLTFGATREPIDGVRFITNFSTGKTGAELADLFVAQGHQVTALAGEGAATPKSSCELQIYSRFDDLNHKMKKLLSERPYDAVIHLAAVSDYSVAEIAMGDTIQGPNPTTKISSDQNITLKLKPNFKILNRLKSYAPATAPMVIGFKLTKTSSQVERDSAVRRVFSAGGVDLVVHNDLSEMQRDERVFTVHSAEKPLTSCNSVSELSEILETIITEKA